MFSALSLISTIVGLLSSFLPNLLDYYKTRQNNAFTLELEKLKIEGAKDVERYKSISDYIKADVDEGKSVRDHDSTLTDTSTIIGALRASVRPVITYTLFALFCGIKIIAVALMVSSGSPVKEMLDVVWDNQTIGFFGAIMGFWFGSRTIEKYQKNNT
jgi:hypothetical protein